MNRIPRLLGLCAQSLVLGTLLFVAIVKLLSVSTGARVFFYQGF